MIITVTTDPVVGTVVHWIEDGVELASASQAEARISGNAPNYVRPQALDAYRTLKENPAADMADLVTG